MLISIRIPLGWIISFCNDHFARALQAAEEVRLLSSRAERGICFLAKSKKKADSSGQPSPRNDRFPDFFRRLFSLSAFINIWKTWR